SVIAELKDGRVRLLAISAPTRLADPFAETPTWIEQSIDCVVGAWRGVTGPAALGPAQIAFWENLLRAATQEPAWQVELARHAWSAMYQDGAALRDYLQNEQAEFASVLGELGLLRQPRAAAMSR